MILIAEKKTEIERVSFEEGLRFFQNDSLEELQEKAVRIRNFWNDPKTVTFIIDTNPNYTNVCTANCSFCAFYRRPKSSQAYTHSVEDVMQMIEQSVNLGVTTVLLQGGLHPDLPLSYYVHLVRETRKHFPSVTPHFFSAPEIKNIADVNKISVLDVLQALYEAGQRTLPGGGAEILTDRVRNLISPEKLSAADWLNVHETAHQVGFRSTATMMFGTKESDEDILTHLCSLRDLQDRTGGFTAFIPWSYKPINSKTVWEYTRNDASMYYRVLAFSRIFLDNFAHIQASWFSEGKETGKKSLQYGADDFGGTLFIENVHKAAKFENKSTVDEIRQLISEAGYNPVQRTTLYETMRKKIAGEMEELL